MGPYRCDTLRHADTTYYPIQGNWGKSTRLVSKDSRAYGDAHECADNILLPNSSKESMGSNSYLEKNNSIEGIGNQYRGVQNGMFQQAMLDREFSILKTRMQSIQYYGKQNVQVT
ncbi:hypothetical protein [Acinetobacter nectaris]|uniref:hypothetical protein n=1 Tax=Acinetobacter nectaris TaxID=1219382 RepID=UPI001F19C142|nr:hypothetical protein [Acinetobacter nectaris]MCF9046849.1 hypothetical protein [Acinetobacter nectaris]